MFANTDWFQHATYNEMDLLAAAQSLLILMTILFFCMKGSKDLPTPNADDFPTEAQILVGAWEVKQQLAMTGLFLNFEMNSHRPRWRDWATTEAKRRTILSLHHLEWAWSLLHGYPVLTCFELGPLPAPAPGYLWRESDEQIWERQYADWLGVWKNGSYKMAEFFYINADEPLNVRAETWLAEADEFGGMLMAEGNRTT